MADNLDQQLNNAFRDTDSKNASHYIYHEIENLYNTDQPEIVRKRWIWELLQNAHDARQDNGIIVEVRYDVQKRKLVFLHNGRGFKAGEIAHLIKSGTTKDENDEATHGKFGRGFLTTHLLSPTVNITGQLNDESWFDFVLERDRESKNTLADSLERSKDAFLNSISVNKPEIPENFTTQFVYPICEQKQEVAVNEGIALLKQCAPYVLIFNGEFLSINIVESDKTMCFKVNNSPIPVASDIQQVTVVKNEAKMEYLLAQNQHQKTSVAVQMKSNSENPICLSVENIPKLFSAFPLVGTDLLSFPAVINNPNFLLPADRDGVQFDKNRKIFEGASNLLIDLINHAALRCWKSVHQWAKIPHPDSLSNQMDTGWEECIKNLIKSIQQTPSVQTLSGEPKSLLESILAVTEKRENVIVLWDLLHDWQEYREKLPKRDEAVGWYDVIKSFQGCELIGFDGRKLATDIQDCSSLKVLQNMLQDVCGVKWLDRFYDFLKKDELFNNMVPEFSFVPNQVGMFCKLSVLNRDKYIDEELKDIDQILGGNLRERLRDKSLTSLEDMDDTKDLNNDKIIGDLIDDLKNKARDTEHLQSAEKFRDASVRLFAWLLSKKQYGRLPDFPTFSKRTDSLDIINLPHPKSDDSPEIYRPLAPVPSWDNDLQNYWKLFPIKHILADRFYDAISDEDIWRTLEEQKYIRKDVIIRYSSNISFKTFQPNDHLSEDTEHESKEEIAISNIAFLTEKNIGIIDSVRKSRPLTYQFWCFLTEWLVIRDSGNLEIVENVPCTCEDTHRYYPALWLNSVVKRKWVSLGENQADYLKTDTLANLLRENGWDPSTLIQNNHISKLLEAVGISRFDLIREIMVDENERYAVEDAMVEIVRKSDGSVTHLNQAIKYIEAAASNESLSEHVEVLLESTEEELSQARKIMRHIQEDNKLFLQEFEKSKDRTCTIKKNQSVGKHVEKLVEQILKEKFPKQKFNVKSVHEGADFEIVELVVSQGNKKLWIEVKSTRNGSDLQEVKMSPLQAKKAVKEKEDFLLCVVPIPEGSEINLEIVRKNMRFIANIGDKVASLCENLDRLEEVRIDITTGATSDVRLDIEKNKAGILVNQTLWEKYGIPLGKLVEHLTKTKNNLIAFCSSEI